MAKLSKNQAAGEHIADADALALTSAVYACGLVAYLVEYLEVVPEVSYGSTPLDGLFHGNSH